MALQAGYCYFLLSVSVNVVAFTFLSSCSSFSLSFSSLHQNVSVHMYLWDQWRRKKEDAQAKKPKRRKIGQTNLLENPVDGFFPILEAKAVKV